MRTVPALTVLLNNNGLMDNIKFQVFLAIIVSTCQGQISHKPLRSKGATDNCDLEARFEKNRLKKVDEESLKQLPEEDRSILESELSQQERQFLLSKLEAGQFDTILTQDRFSFPSFSDITAVVEKIGAGAGQYIGDKLAGDLGGKLGTTIGAYLGVAAANRFTKKKYDTKKKVDPSENGFGYGNDNDYGAMMSTN
ncbi:hypothetical protein HF086_016143 [Spodoptera exigua]|uniref:Uncharacterized protein n=1 Tax=Spodoptera exigua TaxID=7107 RepID=A0A922MHV7_SPOEX|nr:hypothetical protein HF086_016143 [Spodoptera exigua]